MANERINLGKLYSEQTATETNKRTLEQIESLNKESTTYVNKFMKNLFEDMHNKKIKNEYSVVIKDCKADQEEDCNTFKNIINQKIKDCGVYNFSTISTFNRYHRSWQHYCKIVVVPVYTELRDDYDNIFQ